MFSRWRSIRSFSGFRGEFPSLKRLSRKIFFSFRWVCASLLILSWGFLSLEEQQIFKDDDEKRNRFKGWREQEQRSTPLPPMSCLDVDAQCRVIQRLLINDSWWWINKKVSQANVHSTIFVIIRWLFQRIVGGLGERSCIFVPMRDGTCKYLNLSRFPARYSSAKVAEANRDTSRWDECV